METEAHTSWRADSQHLHRIQCFKCRVPSPWACYWKHFHFYQAIWWKNEIFRFRPRPSQILSSKPFWNTSTLPLVLSVTTRNDQCWILPKMGKKNGTGLLYWAFSVDCLCNQTINLYVNLCFSLRTWRSPKVYNFYPLKYDIFNVIIRHYMALCPYIKYTHILSIGLQQRIATVYYRIGQ